jgi:hypothetical protein
MLLPLTHRSKPRWHWIKPGIPRLNKNHPLAQFVSFACLPGATFNDLSDTGSCLFLTSSGTRIMTPEGAALTGANLQNNGANIGVGPRLKPTVNPQITMYWRGAYLSSSAPQGAALFSLVVDTAIDSPYVCYDISQYASSNGGTTDWTGISPLWNNGGAFESTVCIQPAITLGAMNSLACVFDSIAGSVPQVYANGVPQSMTGGTGVGFGTPVYTSTSYLLLGLDSSVAANMAVIFTGLAATAAQIADLDKDPYGLFLWPDDDILSSIVGLAVITPPGISSTRGLFFFP